MRLMKNQLIIKGFIVETSEEVVKKLELSGINIQHYFLAVSVCLLEKKN